MKHSLMKQALPVMVLVGAAMLGTAAMAEAPKQRVELACGANKVSLTCGRDQTPISVDPRKCNRNTVTFHLAQGGDKVIPNPPLTKKFHDDKRPVMLEGTTAMSLECFRTLAGKEYVLMEYGRSLAGGFTNEIFYDLFETDGTRLTLLGIPLKKKFKDPYASEDPKHSSKKVALEGEQK